MTTIEAGEGGLFYEACLNIDGRTALLLYTEGLEKRREFGVLWVAGYATNP